MGTNDEKIAKIKEIIANNRTDVFRCRLDGAIDVVDENLCNSVLMQEKQEDIIRNYLTCCKIMRSITDILDE